MLIHLRRLYLQCCLFFYSCTTCAWKHFRSTRGCWVTRLLWDRSVQIMLINTFDCLAWPVQSNLTLLPTYPKTRVEESVCVSLQIQSCLKYPIEGVYCATGMDWPVPRDSLGESGCTTSQDLSKYMRSDLCDSHMTLYISVHVFTSPIMIRNLYCIAK